MLSALIGAAKGIGGGIDKGLTAAVKTKKKLNKTRDDLYGKKAKLRKKAITSLFGADRSERWGLIDTK